MLHQGPLEHSPDPLEDVVLQVETLAENVQSYLSQVVDLRRTELSK